MCLQQFQRSGCTHLAGDDAGQVILHADDIDTSQLAVFYDNLLRTLEALVFFAFPVEVYPDSHIQQLE